MMNDLPEGFKEALYTVCQTRFGFWDRLKILLGYTFETRTCTYLKFTVDERKQGETEILLLKPKWFPMRKVGYCVEATSGNDKVAPSSSPTGN